MREASESMHGATTPRPGVHHLARQHTLVIHHLSGGPVAPAIGQDQAGHDQGQNTATDRPAQRLRRRLGPESVATILVDTRRGDGRGRRLGLRLAVRRGRRGRLVRLGAGLGRLDDAAVEHLAIGRNRDADIAARREAGVVPDVPVTSGEQDGVLVGIVTLDLRREDEGRVLLRVSEVGRGHPSLTLLHPVVQGGTGRLTRLAGLQFLLGQGHDLGGRVLGLRGLRELHPAPHAFDQGGLVRVLGGVDGPVPLD